MSGLIKATQLFKLRGKERRIMLSKMSGGVWLRLISCSLMILVLGACSNSTQAPAPSPAVSPTPQLGTAECHPPSPLDKSNIGFPEAQGTATGTTLWALFLGGIPPVKGENKIIWRIGTHFQILSLS